MTKPLSITLIVIGDEILNGRTIDLNGQWLAKFLFKRGMELVAMYFIRDNELEMAETLTKALKNSDIVITSGGVGPTIDDKTKKVLANFFKQKIIERDDVATLVTDNYKRFGREWNKSTNHYHLFPENFIPVRNPKGLAPGLCFFDTFQNKLLMSGPGVPREFFAMNEEEFYPLIKKFFPDKFQENFQVVIRTQGIPEEKIFNELCPTLWEELEQYGKVSSLPHTIGIDIIVSFYGDQKKFSDYEEKIIQHIKQGPLALYVWQYGNKNLPEMVLELALQKKLTFAFAESCTGGLTSSKITDLPGSSAVFFGSIISYDNSIKENVIDVSNNTLQNFGAVSLECAKEMAIGTLHRMKTDIAISITGIAGPTGGSKEKPIGTVAIGYATKNDCGSEIFQFPGDRIRLKERFSDKALLILLEQLRKF